MINPRFLKEVLETKISARLIAGFLIIAFLVGFVGIFGIVSSNTIRSNDQLAIELIELENLLDDALIQVLQLIETQNIDDYRELKSNVENIRKEFDVAHQKNDELIHNLGVVSFDENVKEFSRVSNGILALHKEKLIRIRELEEKKQLRRPASELDAIMLEQERVETDERTRIEKLSDVINALEEDEQILVSAIRSKSESIAENTFLILSLIIILAFIVSIVLGLYISYSISRPVTELRNAAAEIAHGDLSERVQVKSKDEIGQLAVTFNKMAMNLEESYKDLKEEKNSVSREKDKLNTILYSIGDGVFVIDTNYRIIMFNQVAADISGFSIEEVVGQKYDAILKFILEKDKRVNDAFIKEAMATGEIKEMTNHTVLVRKDGNTVPIADSAAPLKDKDGTIIGCVVVFRDVTKEREIDRAKSEFVSLASHQLRTPLVTVGWYVEMFLGSDVGRVNEKQKKYLEKIYHNNRRMIELVNTLLNVARIELGTLGIEPKPIDLVEIADSILGELSPQIKNRKLKIEKDYDKSLSIINTDPQLTRIIFQNLLSNAVKYTPDGGTVSLIVKKQKSDILITVSDTGYGIPKTQQSQIFTKLFRADNVRVIDPNGTGLGLYIVKSVVEQFGGKIWFESIENKGTTFYVIIPLSGMKKREGAKGLV